MIRLVVFDVDGTLVDSQAVIVACMGHAFAAAGMAPPRDADVRRVIGLSLPRAIATLAPEAAEDRIGDLVAGYKAHFATVQREASVRERLYPGAREALVALDAGGYLLAVATGKGRGGLGATLARHDLGRHFVSLQTADDAPGKPHPGMLRRAMADAGAAPVETLLVGDTTFDMQMAANAGVAPVGVSWGYHDTPELAASGAAAVIDAFAELAPLVAGWSRNPVAGGPVAAGPCHEPATGR